MQSSCSCQKSWRYKSVGIAIVLSLLPGHFGLLYANFWLGLVACLALLIALERSTTLGLEILIGLWLLSPFLSVFLVNFHNWRLDKKILKASVPSVKPNE